MKRILSILLIAVTLSACQQMGPTQVGIKFRRLPSNLGPVTIGGVSPSIIEPGQLALLMPWDTVYTFDTSIRDISFPSGKGPEDKGRHEGYVNTRAIDGNEVALAITVRYRILPDKRTLTRLVDNVATNDQQVRSLVAVMARADIRTRMNALETAKFLDETSRFGALDKVRDTLTARLAKYGIEVLAVIMDDFRFERLLKDGSVDASYQERITQIQKLEQDTEREKLRKDTVIAKKQEEYNQVQALVNRQVAEADGYKNQARLKGEGYFQSKVNEAAGVLVRGTAEVEGLKQQIEALSGPGGEAILKLEMARQLSRSEPKFVILNQNQSANALSVNRFDANQVLNQLGIIEAMKEGVIERKESLPIVSNVVDNSAKREDPESGKKKGE